MKNFKIKAVIFLVLLLSLNILPVSASENIQTEKMTSQVISSEEYLQPFGEAISDEDIELIDDGEETEIIYDESNPIDQSIEEEIEDFIDLDISEEEFYLANEIEEPEMLMMTTTQPTENPNTGIKTEEYSIILCSFLIITSLMIITRTAYKNI